MYKELFLFDEIFVNFRNRYEISLEEAGNNNYNRIIKNKKSNNFIKPSPNLTVVLYANQLETKRFTLHWLILSNARQDEIPADIGTKKYYVLHRDGDFCNLDPDNLYWSTNPPLKHTSTNGKMVWAEDGKVYNTIRDAIKAGCKYRRIEIKLEPGEHYLKTDVFKQLAEKTGFKKFRKIKISNKGRLMMHDGRLTKGSICRYGKRVITQFRAVNIHGTTYQIHRLVAMAKYNTIIDSKVKITFEDKENTLDEEGMQRNWAQDINIINN